MEKMEKPNILLVDDRLENLEALEGLLEDFDANLIKSTSGNQALDIALKYELALVLMDVQMPKMDGFETAEIMRRRTQSPIVFVTANYKNPQYIFQGYESGAVDYLLKPIDPLILKSKVKVFLNLYEQKQLLEKKNVQLRESQEHLEEKINNRTIELRQTNEALQQQIVEQKRAEEERLRLVDQLHQTQKMKALGTLAGGVAHQFNNLLVPILGFTKRVQTTLDPESKESDYLGRSIKAANRAKELIAQVVILGSSSNLKRESLQLVDILKVELLQLRESLPGSISIREEISDAIPLIKANTSQMHQLIANVCTNARDAMPEGGEMVLTVNKVELHEVVNFQGHLISGVYVYFSVQDSGHGMDEAILERIFEPFFTTKEEGKGVGLGLFGVRGIIEQYDGDIQVKSKLGQGTTLTIYLPVLSE